jgi:ABC-2 type transport system ATP-binding protein
MGLANSPAAALVGVVKRYGRNTALDGVTLNIERGKITALLGPNGAGKSTAIALLLGLATADEGHAELFGNSPQVLAARRRIGVMLQTAALPETLRVGELIELTSTYYPRPRPLKEVARMAGLADLLRRPYGALSGGQQRRVQFALAVCGNPELLFLDEPTTGLDIEARESLWETVRSLVEEGSAVLLTTHYLEEAEALAQRVAVLMGGRIVTEGTIDEIRAIGSRRHIRCLSTISAAQVREWAGVVAVTERDSRLDIEVVTAEPIVRRLMAMDPTLSELEVTRAGLTEAFVQIVRGETHASHEQEGAMHASRGLACEEAA